MPSKHDRPLGIITMLAMLFAFLSVPRRVEAGITAVSPPSPFTSVDVTTLTNWQICNRQTFTSTGPNFTSTILNVCGGDRLILSCAQTGDDTLIVGAAADKTTITGQLVEDNALWFLDTVGVGAGGFVNASDSAPVSCGTVGLVGSPNSALCYNFQGDEIVGGGYCGAAGVVNSPAFERVILAAPCEGLNIGDPCTPPEGLCVNSPTCQADGSCVGTPVAPPALNQCQKEAICDPLTGTFTIVNQNVGFQCSDGSGCTQNDVCDGNANCISGQPVACPQPPFCSNVGFCISLNDTAFDCAYAPLPAGFGCSDGLSCTVGDQCDGNFNCVPGSPKVCLPQGLCQTNGTCIEPTGACAPNFLPDTTPCTAVDKCAETAECQTGACVPLTFKTCTNAVCQFNATCDTGTGNCVGTPAPQGTPCVNDPCRTGQTCNSVAACTGGVAAITCNNPPECFQNGSPVNVNGTCQCSYPQSLSGSDCDDGDPCTFDDFCITGSCIPGTSVNCDGNLGDPCTTGVGGVCIPFAGCTNWVSDGVACTPTDPDFINGTCSSGFCASNSDEGNSASLLFNCFDLLAI